MNKFETKFDIDDAVYMVSGDEPCKKVIRAIKVTSNKIEYAFESSGYGFGILSQLGDKYAWYEESKVFETKRQARDSINSKKAELERKQKTLKEQLAEVEEELDELKD